MLGLRKSSKLLTQLRVQAASVQVTAKYHKEKVEPEHLDSVGKWIQYLRFNNPFYFDIQHHLKHDKWAKLFAIEGNIGVGKSAFAKEFSEILELKNFPQTTDYSYNWLRSKRVPQEKIDYESSGQSVTAIAKNTSLKNFLENPQDLIHSMRYQLERHRWKHMQYMDALKWLLTTGQGVVIKRQYFTDPVIMHALRKMNWTTKPYHDYYKKNHKYCSTYVLHPQVVIYLDATPEQCYDNVQKNGTELEKKLPLDFYKYIDEGYHELYFPRADEEGVNLVKIDWTENVNVEEIIDDLDELPTLHHPYNQWETTTEHLHLVRDHASSTIARLMDSDRIYHFFDELDDPWWMETALYEEKKVVPWRYQYGFNKALGDKNVNFRATYPHDPLARQ